MFILDASTDQPILKDTLYGKGIKGSNHVLATEQYVFFINTTGVYIYNGEEIKNVILVLVFVINMRMILILMIRHFFIVVMTNLKWRILNKRKDSI